MTWLPTVIRYSQKLTKINALVCVALMAASCASVDQALMGVSDAVSSPDPVTGQRQINLEREQEEIRRAEVQSAQILAEFRKAGRKIDRETPYFTRVKIVFDRLRQVAHRQDLPWQVHVVEDDKWNAFTIGGGKIFVQTGLLQPPIGVQSDDELAAILAHEIAHVTARHASEKQGKLMMAGLADKSLRRDRFAASFTTNQEDEADKYSVIYSALAGYNPTAGITVWKRLDKAFGSYTGNMLYDHPLSDDRARNLESYASKAWQYYTQGQIHPNHVAILADNALFSYRAAEGLKAGEGGGVLALLETASNTYLEVLEAKTEQSRRELKRLEQERLARRYLIFDRLQVAPKQGGGHGLFGMAINATNRSIQQAHVAIDYYSGQTVILTEKLPWQAMKPHEKTQFGFPLKSISYTSVSIRPVYVQLSQ